MEYQCMSGILMWYGVSVYEWDTGVMWYGVSVYEWDTDVVWSISV